MTIFRKYSLNSINKIEDISEISFYHDFLIVSRFIGNFVQL
jgi:hypothetical protein